MLDTTNGLDFLDTVLSEADDRLASPSPPTPTLTRYELDGMVVVGEVAFDGRVFVVVADIDREDDRRGWFYFASLRNAPQWTTGEQDEQIAQLLCDAWEAPPMKSAHPHQSIESIAEQWERDVADHESEGPTVRIPVVSMDELVWGEMATHGGCR